jgi:ribosomal protein S18 acetylase RimI-like enzyme
MPRLALVQRLEAAAVRAWPATIQRAAPGGWLLRATPGLDRGRSNNALTPCRELAGAELGPAIDRVLAFAAEQRIAPGIQVSPLALHGPLQRELDARSWRTQWPTLVLTGPVDFESRPAPELDLLDHASAQWLRTWSTCEPGRDVEAHAATVFAQLRGRATFARLDSRAVAITVESDGLVGMFCLAVDPGQRRTGLATSLVGALLARSSAALAYLQVEEPNAAARAMYERLGFAETYRYSHRTAD